MIYLKSLLHVYIDKWYNHKMKKVVYTVLILFLTLPLCGYTLKGGVTFTVEQARKEAFDDVQYRLPQSIINAHLKDPNYKENINAKGKGQFDLGDRKIAYFSDGGYGLVYSSNPFYEYYYSPKGNLEMIGKRSRLYYPTKSYKYNINGKLNSIILYINQNESYVFLPSGMLSAHWVGNKCYDLNGNLVEQQF